MARFVLYVSCIEAGTCRGGNGPCERTERSGWNSARKQPTNKIHEKEFYRKSDDIDDIDVNDPRLISESIEINPEGDAYEPLTTVAII